MDLALLFVSDTSVSFLENGWIDRKSIQLSVGRAGWSQLVDRFNVWFTSEWVSG